MSFYFPNIDPVYVYKRKGDATDPFMLLTQTSKVLNGKVILKEIPDFQSSIVAKNSSQVVLTKTTNETLLSNQYRIDFSVGHAYFHTSLEGQIVTIDYKGTGYVSFPAGRVWLEETSAQGDQTLQDIVTRLKDINVATLDSKVGNLTILQNADKSSIVNALNETTQKLTEKAKQSDVENYLSENVYYDEITFEKYRDTTSLSDYYITHIPNLDSKGQLIKLKHGYQNDLMNSGNGETARSFSKRHVASFVSNASIWSTSTGLIKGVQIKDGVILQDIDGGTSYTLGVKADNTLKAYAPNVTAQAVINDGCVQAFTGFYPMIENGVAVDPAIYNVILNPSEVNPRQIIAQLTNKDILFMTVEGRTSKSVGMTYADVIRVLLARGGVSFAYCLDGGGSTQSVVRGMAINQAIDGGGKVERKVGDVIYVAREATYKQNFSVVSSDLGVVNKRLADAYAELTTLQDTVTALSAPTWTNLTLLNGTTAITGREPRYTKVGKRVTVEGEIANITAGTIIATLPTGYRPPTVRLVKGAINSTATNDGVTFVLSINGAITIQASANTTSPISLMGISFFVD